MKPIEMRLLETKVVGFASVIDRQSFVMIFGACVLVLLDYNGLWFIG